MTLAVASYAGLPSFADRADVLDLAWTLDEREFLAVDVLERVRQGLLQEAMGDLEWTRRYMVQDPHGSVTLGPAIAAHFAVPPAAEHTSCAAGVNGLLHALATVWPAADVLVAAGVYPDFPHWLQRAGARLHAMPTDAGAEEWSRVAHARKAPLWFVERPSFFGGAPWDQLAAARELVLAASQAGAVVVIDESNANYWPTGDSAVAATQQVDNLVVLRGLSKAYGLGGLRIGYAVSSPALTARVRAAIAPLQASSVSLQLARLVLEAGDLAAPLRERLARAKERAAALLVRVGIPLEPCAAGLPYLLPSDVGLLNSLAVRTKRHPLWEGGSGLRFVNRMSVPLREARLHQFENRLQQQHKGNS